MLCDAMGCCAMLCNAMQYILFVPCSAIVSNLWRDVIHCNLCNLYESFYIVTLHKACKELRYIVNEVIKRVTAHISVKM